MNSFVVTVPFALFSITGSLLAGPETNAAHDIKDRAKALVQALAGKDYAGATRDFDDVMRNALPAGKLKEIWTSLTDKMGAFTKAGGVRAERVQKYDIVYVTCEFEKGSLDAKVVFGSDLRVTGLFFVPTKSKSTYRLPEYVRPDSFDESERRVGSGEWALPATLTIPRGDGPFPAVVLVHGSGPHDRDETIVANKPFRDLAWGLGSRGVAVLRYDKRTKEYAAKLAATKDKLTVQEEVIDDARAAIALLRKTEKIDPRRIFLLGHSLGAVLAPRIGAGDRDLAGIIVLAANTRPLEDVIVDQFTYLLTKDGLTDTNKQQLAQIKEQAARVKDPNLSAEVPAEKLPLNIPAAYWLDLRGYDPAAIAAKDFCRPILILQGERDYQVTMEDFQGWQKKLGKRKDVALKSYPRLNHLFMAGEGKATPEEYEKAGHVDREVVEDIAAWLKKPSRD